MRNILLLLKLFVMAALLATAQSSYAQAMRVLPADGKRGITGERQPMAAVVINRKEIPYAPGSLIFDTQNRTILRQSLPVGADVWYQLNTTGDIRRIYILTPTEQARLDRAKK